MPHKQREKEFLMFSVCVCICVFVFNDYQPCALCLSLSVADNKHPFIQKACFFGHNSHTFLHLCSVSQITIARNRKMESEQL